jgi:hypothetical protein
MNALLRALGTLLVAIAGGEDEGPQPADEPAAPPARVEDHADDHAERSASAFPRQPRVEHAMTLQPPDPGSIEQQDEEIATLLADARARAQALIDESVERAEELIRQRPSEQVLERIRRSVADLTMDVRALHSRLDDIESAVRSVAATRDAPSAPAQQPPAFTSPSQYAPVEPPVYQAPAPSFEWPAPPPPSAYPPEPAGLVAEATPGVADSMDQEDDTQSAVPPPAYGNGEMPAPEAAVPMFEPDDGSVTLHISPVAGFQGLMRVQDALTRVRGVREAGVEAYAQGEARLRLQLVERVEPGELAASLGASLGRPTRLTAASTSERMLQVALE